MAGGLEPGSPAPDPAELWERFLAARRAELDRRKSLVRRRILVFGAVVCAVVFVVAGVAFLAFPAQVRAAGERLTAVKAVLAGNGLPDGEFTVQEIPVPDPVVLTTDELPHAVPFPVRLPEYFPEGYTLVEHTYQPLSGSSGMLSSEYRNGDKFIHISQDHFGGGGFGYGTGFDKDSSRVLQVRVREAEGTLIERRKNGTASLVWFEGAALYQIGGYLTPEEVLAMAESMRVVH